MSEPESLTLHLWTDGCNSGYGVVIKDEKGKTLRELAGAAPIDALDYSETEYMAVILGLREARQLGATAVCVHSDSLFLVDQMAGGSKVKSPRMVKPNAEAVAASEGLETEFVHISGESNGDADRLSRALPRIQPPSQ